MPWVTAGILCGGKSTRLGGIDKSQIVIAGQTIMQRQYQLLCALKVPMVAVASKRPTGLPLAVPCINDLIGGQGPLDGLAAALRWSSTPWLLLLACDMPGLQESFLAHLIKRAASLGRKPAVQAIAAQHEGRFEPMAALYHQSLFPQIEARLAAGKLGMQGLLHKARVEKMELAQLASGITGRLHGRNAHFANLNTPDEIESFQKSVAQVGLNAKLS